MLFGQTYRICRRTGDLEKQRQGIWADANTHAEVLTLFDLLCDSQPDRHISGQWKNMGAFGMLFHQNLLEDKKDSAAALFDREPERLRRNLAKLGARPGPGGDISGVVEVFDGLPLAVQFWHGDEEFPPRLRYLWDENALQYIRYETMFYAVPLLLKRLMED